MTEDKASPRGKSAGEGETFLTRWSRVKSEARESAAAAPAPAAAQAAAEDAPPALPPVESLTIDSDFKGFFHPKVGEDVRRAALRKLFSDPHFNVMDGLDVYIDDYSKSEPLPAAMLAGLKQAQRILDWAAESEEAAAERRSRPPQLPGRESDPEEIESAGADETQDTGVPQSAATTREAPAHLSGAADDAPPPREA